MNVNWKKFPWIIHRCNGKSKTQQISKNTSVDREQKPEITGIIFEEFNDVQWDEILKIKPIIKENKS